jgi:hypothetical protein
MITRCRAVALNFVASDRLNSPLKGDICAAKSDVHFTQATEKVDSRKGHSLKALDPKRPIREADMHPHLIERELRLGCLRFFGARRGAASVRYVHLLVFILEVLKHKQTDRRR